MIFLLEGWNEFSELHKGVGDRKAKAMKQLGTLGGGNHFIEVCLDTENFVWLMLHSGSRNIGKELAERHISTAKSLWRLSELPSPDLAYFIQGSAEFAAYWKDLKWAQSYAMKNREIMMTRLLKAFNKMFNHRQPFKPELAVNCHHNYVALEEHYGEKVSSRARAQSTPTRTCTASFPDRWARNRSSSKDAVHRRVLIRALTVLAARCHVGQQSEPLRRTTSLVRLPALNAART